MWGAFKICKLKITTQAPVKSIDFVKIKSYPILASNQSIQIYLNKKKRSLF